MSKITRWVCGLEQSRPAGGGVSNVDGPNTPQGQNPWEMSLGDFWDQAVARSPKKVFVEMSGRKFTYRELQQKAMRTAGMFQEMGVGRGDRVGLFMPNCPEYLFCWFGLAALGAIGVPINTAYKRDETVFILNDSATSALVAHESLISVAQEAAVLTPSLRHKLVVAAAPSSSCCGGFPRVRRCTRSAPTHASYRLLYPA